MKKACNFKTDFNPLKMIYGYGVGPKGKLEKHDFRINVWKVEPEKE